MIPIPTLAALILTLGPALPHTFHPQPAMGEKPDPDGLMEIEGVLETGTECPVVRTDDGRVFALSAEDHGIEAGNRVRVTGTLVEMSFCMQGDGTIGVTTIRPL